MKLSQLLPISNPEDYKVHTAYYNKKDEPLDVFVRDRKEWDGWNTWRKNNDRFNRSYILALIDFYPEPDIWLFGGIYKVLSRSHVNYSQSYKIERVPKYENLVGRLKIRFSTAPRIDSLRLEEWIEEMFISELLKERYSGECFPGYENISHDFDKLEVIFQNHRPDWKAALENVKGVYLIIDKKNGKKYVGSAYGGAGVWARWSCYIGTGHGWTDELTILIAQEGLDYARQYFRISLLEYRPAKTDDKVIFEREKYWKKALLSQGQYGYNKN